MSDNEKRTDEKNIGRRTFLGLLLAGIVAFFAGKDVIPRLVTSGSSPVTTTLAGGPSGGSTTTTEAESPTAGFRINSVKKGPDFDPAAWRLTIGGLVGAPFSLTFADLTALPQTTVVRDFYCVEGWGVTSVEWKGVLVRELMQRAKVDAKATHLVFRSGDGTYADSLTLEQSALDDVLLVHQVNGVLLPPEMGQPLRLIYPGHYGYKYVKWVERVEAIDATQTDFEGYWESEGYPADANIPGQ
jgi:DMSO/TMAO reductase YedYZ molybdopterin-dependent catalytic subunit